MISLIVVLGRCTYQRSWRGTLLSIEFIEIGELLGLTALVS